MTEVTIKVKWGKEVLDIVVDLNHTGDIFKAQLESLTGVPAAKQKVMGVKGGQLKDTVTLQEAGVAANKTLMMIGTAEAAPSAPHKPVAFIEDGINAAAALQSSASFSNGLHNLGNSCYLNSAVQVLRVIPELRSILEKNNTPLERVLLKLYKELDSTTAAVNPNAFFLQWLTSLPQYAELSERGGLMQHDSQEALSELLTLISRTISSHPDFRRFARLFCGQKKTTKKIVGKEGSTKVEMIPFTVVQCHIQDEVQTLEAGLEKGMEEMTEGKDEETGEPAVFSSVSKLAELPEYLFAHFVRFQWRAELKKKVKMLKPIAFPLVLDAYTLCDDQLKHKMDPKRAEAKIRRDAEIERRKRSRQRTQFEEDMPAPVKIQTEDEVDKDKPVGNECAFYELCGVISHKGRDSDGGHYVAWVKKDDTWLCYDDENAGPVKEEDVLRLAGVGEAHIAYVLLYRSRNPVTGALPMLL